MRLGSLFTGAGGLDLVAASVLDTEPAWVCDNDPAAARLLAHHWPHVPNLGDIATVDWPQVEPVDVLTAGWPCQDISNAGKRAGIQGDRSGLFAHVAHAVRLLRPSLVVLENVSALAVRGLDTVLGELAALGFDADWCCLPASAIGACHRRERWFCVAADPDRAGRGSLPEPHRAPRQHRGGAPCGHAHRRADPATQGRQRDVARLPTPRSSDRFGTGTHGDGGPDLRTTIGELLPTPQARDGDRAGRTLSHSTAAKRYAAGRRNLDDGIALLPTSAAARAGRSQSPSPGAAIRPSVVAGHSTGWGAYAPAIARWEAMLGRPAPEPTVTGTRGGRVLNPALVEWMQGLPDGHVTGVPGLSRNDMLRLLGNAAVPAQSEAALRWLLPLLLDANEEEAA